MNPSTPDNCVGLYHNIWAGLVSSARQNQEMRVFPYAIHLPNKAFEYFCPIAILMQLFYMLIELFAILIKQLILERFYYNCLIRNEILMFF